MTTEPVLDAEAPAHFNDVKRPLSGIGGWLALVAFGQVLGLLKFLGGLAQYYNKSSGSDFRPRCGVKRH